jgi:phytoene synthase
MMTAYIASWEHRLLTLAHEGLESHVEPGPEDSWVYRTAPLLDRAYDHCAAITQEHSRTFYLASGLLPPDKRRAARALYAFCRVSDDLVDRADGDLLAGLEDWRRRAMAPHPSPDDAVALAWADTRARYHIPSRYAEQLIDGVARDLLPVRYATFEDLAAYAYSVASTVGLMAMHIIGYAGIEAIPYAVKLGVALQLTNILRDVGEDWRAGRFYLPQDELAAFGLTEADVAAGRVDDRWRGLMRFQIARTRRLYDEAMPGIALLNPDGRFAITAAADLYRAILTDIEAHDYDVFARRASLSAWGKLRRLPGIWRRARMVR